MQGIRVWQRALAGGLSGSIHIDDELLLAYPIKQATRGGKRVVLKHVFLKERPQGFHRSCIEVSRETGTKSSDEATDLGQREP